MPLFETNIIIGFLKTNPSPKTGQTHLNFVENLYQTVLIVFLSLIEN